MTLDKNMKKQSVITIYLKDKIDAKILNNALIKIGLTSVSIEIKNLENYENYYYLAFNNNINIDTINSSYFIKIDEKKSCLYINSTIENIDIYLKIKEILFKEKILNEIYDKANEYKDNYKQYEAKTDNIIKRIEAKKLGQYNLFIIKHFIKYIIDKYKVELILSKNYSKKDNKIKIHSEIKNIDKKSNKKYIILACINQRKAQIKDKKEEIKEIIKDFDYSTKKDYKNEIARIENHINNTIKELENIQIQNFGNEHIFMIDKINGLIEGFNRIYKNAYNKKNNESSLSYIMDIEIEENTNLDLVKTIDINDFK